MTYRELDRLTIIKQVISRHLTQKKASELLKLSERQVCRLKRRHQLEGPSGLISKRRGRPSNRKHPVEIRAKALNLIHEHFYDYGPTLAAEKLDEYFNVTISKETARQWMTAEAIWHPHNIEKYGVPRATYSDKHGVFKVNHPESKSGTGLTQFGRALNELGVELIFAQAL